MKKDMIKNVIIVVLLLAIAGLVMLMTLNNTSKKNNFLTEVIQLQGNISYYVGQKMEETFQAYDKSQILLGKSDGKEIKSIDNTVLTPLCDIDSKKEKDGKVYYKLNNENVKKILNIDLSGTPEISYYVEDGSYVRAVILNEPSWWNKEYNPLKIQL